VFEPAEAALDDVAPPVEIFIEPDRATTRTTSTAAVDLPVTTLGDSAEMPRARNAVRLARLL
jgi:hypothetical protein